MLGALALVNVVGALRHPGFDQNVWWVDLRSLPLDLEQVLMALAAVAMLAWALGRDGDRARLAGVVAFAGLAFAASLDAVRYYRLWSDGAIAPTRPVPLSLLLALVFGGFAVLAARARTSPGRRPAMVAVAVAMVSFVLVVPLAQIAFFGTTDYRRPADAAVVFGARVLGDGTPSIALEDRIETGVELYRDGLVSTLVMTGALERDSGFDETVVMAERARILGVPASAIIRDPLGTSTLASVRSTTSIIAAEGFERVLAVSHSYHLPRIELSYDRAGFDVATVPARTTPIPQGTANAAREIPGSLGRVPARGRDLATP